MSTSGRTAGHRKAKKTYHHRDLRAALVNAAETLVDAAGPAALSLREAARRAGVSHSAPYRHFPHREGLLAAVAAEGFAMLGKALEQAAKRGGREMGEAYVRFALEHPHRFRLMFGGGISIAAYPELRASATRAYDALARSFAGLGGERETRNAAAAAWSLVHGLANLLLEDQFPQATRDARDTGAFVREVIASIRFAVGAQRPA